MPLDTSNSPTGFRVHSHEIDGWMVVECHGKLTGQNAPLLKEEVRTLIPLHKQIVLDMKEVPMIDSSGLGTVATLYISARTRGCQLQVINANEQIKNIFRMTNLLSLFELAGRHHGKTF
ncbi:MAG: STAS domain-containing protein [Candidatus Acidiferrum sp.]|jgi:anti-anti-sigma factor